MCNRKSFELKDDFLGDAGDWTQDLIHAKHALYHWATSPDGLKQVSCSLVESSTLRWNASLSKRDMKLTTTFTRGSSSMVEQVLCMYEAKGKFQIALKCWGLNPGHLLQKKSNKTTLQFYVVTRELSLETLGIEPRSSYMQSMCSTTEPLALVKVGLRYMYLILKLAAIFPNIN